MALADQGVKGATVGLFCEDYPSLLDRQISKIRVEFPASLGELKEGVTRDFVLAPKYGGGRILLRNLDDPSKYLSAEFAGIAVDELTRNTNAVFDFLRSRLRWPGVSSPRFVAGTNPSGKGHGWVKKLWIERDFPAELKKMASEFAFVPAKSSDNPFLSENYHADLETLPPDMAKAYAEGSWDVFAGQYFDIWNADTKSPKCMVDRPESWGIKPWWPNWISIDWGFQHDAAAYWFTTDNDKYFTKRELVKNQLSPRLLAAEICKLSVGENIKRIYLSPDAFAKRTDENSIAEQMGEVFQEAGLPYPTPADNDRVGGWMLLYQMLASGHLRVGDNCPRLIKCLPTLVRDELKVEDVAKMDGDDTADAWRYGIKSHLAGVQVPVQVRVQARLDALAVDMSQKMVQRERIMREERKATIHQPIRMRRSPRWAIK